MVGEIRAAYETKRTPYETKRTPIVISGCIGPRGGGYDPGALMRACEAEAYHWQVGVLCDAPQRTWPGPRDAGKRSGVPSNMLASSSATAMRQV
jgi:hypothetical protein